MTRPERRDLQPGADLRGQRVELGEIEHLASTQPGVRQAVALVDTQTDGTQSLWAFAAMQPDTDGPAAEPTQAEWRSLLAAKLPAYMIPAAVIRVPAIPTNMAGKVAPHKKIRFVEFIDAVPKSAAGKILRKDLKAR